MTILPAPGGEHRGCPSRPSNGRPSGPSTGGATATAPGAVGAEIVGGMTPGTVAPGKMVSGGPGASPGRFAADSAPPGPGLRPATSTTMVPDSSASASWSAPTTL